MKITLSKNDKEIMELAHNELWKDLSQVELYVLHRWFKHQIDYLNNETYYDQLEMNNPKAFEAHDDEENALDGLVLNIFFQRFPQFSHCCSDGWVITNGFFFTTFLRGLVIGSGKVIPKCDADETNWPEGEFLNLFELEQGGAE